MQLIIVPSEESGRPAASVKRSTIWMGLFALAGLFSLTGYVIGSIGSDAKRNLTPLAAQHLTSSSGKEIHGVHGEPAQEQLALLKSDHSRQFAAVSHKLESLAHRHEQQRQISERLTREIAFFSREVGLRIGELQAQTTRLNALGSRLIASTDLPFDDLSLNAKPAIGGPEEVTRLEATSAPESVGNVIAVLNQLKEDLAQDEDQLEVLSLLLRKQELKQHLYPTSWPSDGGWLSSKYGIRHDPFTGAKSMHHGVDIANSAQAPILASAAGVVSYAGERPGYGLIVEINHGNGISTRYAHAHELLVKPGQRVARGDLVGRVGQTGRATGPHLHFEVLHDGRSVDPATFLGDSG